ncbi:MAG: hypothetical protein AABZ31_00110 [Bdellovibrionota bacterium]
MHSNEDIANLYSFLKQTPEGALRKMLVAADLTDGHFRLLVKLAKGADEAAFTECFNSEGFGQMRLSAKELPMKETFWPICKKKVMSLGLISAEKKAA